MEHADAHIKHMADMPQTSNSRAEFASEIRRFWQSMPHKGVFLVLALAWGALFHFLGNNTFGYRDTPSLFNWMYYVYTTSPDDDYCLIMPLVVIALLMWKRRELTAVEKAVWFPAGLLLLAGVLLHVAGYLIQQNRVSLIGFVVGLYGITGLVWGRRWLVHSFFPMFLLLFLVPLGTLQDGLTLPLRIFVTQASVLVGNVFLGLGYETRGALILTDLGVPVFDVAPACSGIRSLISLFALATVYAFMRFDQPWKRLIVIAAAIPLAVLGNLARIFIVLVVGRAISFEAGAVIEQKLGFLTFLVAFAGLFLLGKQLKEKLDDEPSPDTRLAAAI